MAWRTHLSLLAVVVGLGAVARTAEAGDCYEVKAGTALYAEVMGETVVGKTTADVVGWFGRTHGSEPTMWLRFVALDGGVLVTELDAYVRKDDVQAAACPASWRRGPGETSALTWPDARRAGTGARAAIAVRKKKGKKKHGRSCFAAAVPGVSATVCVAVDERAKVACLSIPAGKAVYAKASMAAKLGETTQAVVAESGTRVDGMLRVSVFDRDDSLAVYVRRADARAVACPAPEEESSVGVLSSIPPHQALLPDGSDAGYRVRTPFGGTETVTVGDLTLRCFDDTPVTGLRLRVCVQ